MNTSNGKTLSRRSFIIGATVGAGAVALGLYNLKSTKPTVTVGGMTSTATSKIVSWDLGQF